MDAATHAEDGQVGQAADEDCLPCMAAFTEAVVTEKGCSLPLRQLHWLNPHYRRLQQGLTKYTQCCLGSCKCVAFYCLQSAWLGHSEAHWQVVKCKQSTYLQGSLKVSAPDADLQTSLLPKAPCRINFLSFNRCIVVG